MLYELVLLSFCYTLVLFGVVTVVYTTKHIYRINVKYMGWHAIPKQAYNERARLRDTRLFALLGAIGAYVLTTMI